MRAAELRAPGSGLLLFDEANHPEYTEEGFAEFGAASAPSRGAVWARLCNSVPFSARLLSPAQRAPSKQAIFGNFAGPSEVWRGRPVSNRDSEAIAAALFVFAPGSASLVGRRKEVGRRGGG